MPGSRAIDSPDPTSLEQFSRRHDSGASRAPRQTSGLKLASPSTALLCTGVLFVAALALSSCCDSHALPFVSAPEAEPVSGHVGNKTSPVVPVLHIYEQSRAQPIQDSVDNLVLHSVAPEDIGEWKLSSVRSLTVDAKRIGENSFVDPLWAELQQLEIHGGNSWEIYKFPVPRQLKGLQSLTLRGGALIKPFVQDVAAGWDLSSITLIDTTIMADAWQCFPQFRALAHLSLQGSSPPDESGELKVLQGLVKMESLELHWATWIDDRDIRSAIPWLARLKRLSLAGLPIEAETFFGLLGQDCRLSFFGASSCSRLKDAKLCSLPASIEEFDIAQTDLDLTQLRLEPSNSAIRALDLSTSKVSYQTALELCRLPGLQSVNLSYVRGLTPAMFRCMLSHWPALREVAVNGCAWFNDNVLLMVGSLAPRLRLLENSETPAKASALSFILSKQCPRIRQIKLGGFLRGISMDDTIDLAARGRSLTHITHHGYPLELKQVHKLLSTTTVRWIAADKISKELEEWMAAGHREAQHLTVSRAKE